MFKKLLVLILFFILIISITGCGSGGGNNPSDQDLINTLLDNIQTYIKSLDADKLVSVCTFPFNDNGTTYNDAATMKSKYETDFADIASYDAYNLTSRVVTISGTSATVSLTMDYKVTLKDSASHEETSPFVFSCKKIDGSWKFSGEVISTNTTNNISSTVLGIKGAIK